MLKCAGIGLAVAVVLAEATVAHGQSRGVAVRIETQKGTIEGTLVDRLPYGYLLSRGKRSEVIPYAKVRSITRLEAPASEVTPVAPVVPNPTLKLPERHALPPEMPAPVPPDAMPFLPKAAASSSLVPRSKVLMGTGIMLVAAGATTAMMGAVTCLIVRDGTIRPCLGMSRDSLCSRDRTDRLTTGSVLAGAGAAVVAMGVPLWIMGGTKVPAGAGDAPSTQTGLSLGPGSAELTVRF